jgi:WD40 repeat protein
MEGRPEDKKLLIRLKIYLNIMKKQHVIFSFIAIGLAIISCFNCPCGDISKLKYKEQIAKLYSHYGTLVSGHVDEVTSFISRNDILYTGSKDYTIRIWDLKEHKQLSMMEGHTSAITCMILTKNSDFLISGSWDWTIRIWNLKQKTLIGVLRGHTDWVTAIQLSPDEKTLYSVSRDSTVRVWDLSSLTQTAILKGHDSFVWSLALSSDGKLAVSGSSDKKAIIWDLKTLKAKIEISDHNGSINNVAFSQDGQFIYTGGPNDDIHLWDSNTGDSMINVYTGGVKYFRVYDDETIVYVNNHDTIGVYDMVLNKNLNTFEVDNKYMTVSKFYANDDMDLVFYCVDITIYVVDIKEWKMIEIIPEYADIKEMKLSKSRKYAVISYEESGAGLWDLVEGKLVESVKGVEEIEHWLSS